MEEKIVKTLKGKYCLCFLFMIYVKKTFILNNACVGCSLYNLFIHVFFIFTLW